MYNNYRLLYCNKIPIQVQARVHVYNQLYVDLYNVGVFWFSTMTSDVQELLQVSSYTFKVGTYLYAVSTKLCINSVNQCGLAVINNRQVSTYTYVYNVLIRYNIVVCGFALPFADIILMLYIPNIRISDQYLYRCTVYTSHYIDRYLHRKYIAVIYEVLRRLGQAWVILI